MGSQQKTIAAGDRLLTAQEVVELMARCDRLEEALRSVSSVAECMAMAVPPTANVPRQVAVGPLQTIQGLADGALERK